MSPLIIPGLGAGTYVVATSMVVMMYFDRYRGLANGIKSMGATVASLFFPQLITLTKELYGFRNTLLLYGAVAMNLTSFVIAFKEPPWYRKTHAVKKHEPAPEAHDVYTQDKETPLGETSAECATGKTAAVSLSQVPGESSIPDPSNTPSGNPFRLPVFYLLLASAVTAYYTQSVLFSTIVDYYRDKGLTIADGANLMTSFAAIEIAGRLLFPLLSDRGYVGRTQLLLASFAAKGVSMFVIVQVRSFAFVMVGTLSFGAALGCAISLQNVVVTEHLGVNGIPLCMGLAGLITVPLFLANPFVMGK